MKKFGYPPGYLKETFQHHVKKTSNKKTIQIFEEAKDYETTITEDQLEEDSEDNIPTLPPGAKTPTVSFFDLDTDMLLAKRQDYLGLTQKKRKFEPPTSLITPLPAKRQKIEQKARTDNGEDVDTGIWTKLKPLLEDHREMRKKEREVRFGKNN